MQAGTPASTDSPRASQAPRIVIIGGGFGGLYAAKSLAKAPVDITVIDRRNHHLFQPLLYQVATAALSPADIAAPIRHVLSRQRNTQVLLAEATAVDVARRIVTLAHAPGVETGVHEVPYDYLIVATGASHSYFGHDDWAPFAPALKTVEDAVEIRRRILLAFERAELERDAAEQRRELTFMVVGGGPTGVEMAGALAEIAVRSIPADFRHVDTTTARVVLVEAQDRLLAGFPAALSDRARRDLERMRVEVRVHQRVVGVDHDGIDVQLENGASERIEGRNVIWAAGVKASQIVASLGAPMDRVGRVIVEPDLSVPGHPEVFVVGDAAKVIDTRTGREVPGQCPPAIQMGLYVAREIAREIRAVSRAGAGRTTTRRPFLYHDKGQLATIGRAKAVAEVAGVNFGGLIAWVLWAFVHIFYLIGFRNRLLVMIEWAWAYIAFERGARLITGDTDGSTKAPARPAAPLPKS